MTIFFTEADLQIAGLRMFDGVMHDLLDHPEDMDLFFLGDRDLLDDIQLDIDRLFTFYLLDEFPDGFDQPLSFKGIGQQVMGNAPHAADDLVQVACRFVEDLPVGGSFDVDTADIQFYRGKEGTKAVMEVSCNPLAFVFPDGDLGKDLFALQSHIPAVIPDDGYEEVDNYYGNNQRYQQRDIEDLVFHDYPDAFPFCRLGAGSTTYQSVNFLGEGIRRKAIAKIMFVRALM